METQKKSGRYPVSGTQMVFVVVLIISAVFPFGVDGWPKRADPKACPNMTPNPEKHGAKPQTDASPYHISLGGASVKKGEKTTVELMGEGGFKGFLIKVEKAGDTSGKAQGDWEPDDENAQVLKGICSDGNGLTHTKNNTKNKVTAKWIASAEPGDYQVFYTAVMNKATFWVRQQTPEHKMIKVTAGAGAAKTSMILTAILPVAVSFSAVLLRSSVPSSII